jgi:hypothetical protein
MATTLKTKNSVTAASAPSSLAQGELAVNITDKKMWVGNAATTPVQIVGNGVAGGAGGSNTQVQYNSSGILAGSANLTFNGTTLTTANDASISGLTVGRGGGTLTGNTVVGNIALPANTTGSYNSAFGYGALYVNTTGSYNTAVGREALKSVTTNAGNTAVGALALGLTTADANTAVGGFTLQANTTGANNTGLGSNALYSNTTASNNTAVGYQASYAGTTGASNTAVGYQANYATTTGTLNSAFGVASLAQNTTGSNNTAYGVQTLYSNTTASNNTAVGYQSMYSNTTGTGYNTALGYQSMYLNTTGANNTAIGNSALFTNTTGSENQAFGRTALYLNTTGSNNVAVGTDALRSNTTASNNTAVGYQAGYANTTGSQNVFLGRNAGISTTTGSFNTYVGDGAGYGTTGSSNTFVGLGAGSSVTTGGKNSILGQYTGNQGGLDIRTADNYIVLSDGDGNPRYWHDGTSATTKTRSFTNSPSTGTDGANFINSNTSGSFFFAIDSSAGGTFGNGNYQRNIYSGGAYNIYVTANSNGVYLANGGVAWVANSDERLKENLVPITDAVNKVSTLRAVTGNYIKDEDKKSRSFLIAQDIQAVFPQAVDSSNPDMLGVAYTDVIPLLVAAIKELKAEVDSLKQQLGK